MVQRLIKQGYQTISAHFRQGYTASEGFLLPVVVVLGLAVGTVSVVALQSVAQNSVTLNNQYYDQVAREAAQAGVAAAASCIRAGTAVWAGTDPANPDMTPLSPTTGCNGSAVTGKVAYVADDPLFTSTYTVNAKKYSNNTIIVTSLGNVLVKGPGGITVKTITKSVRTFAKTASASTARVSRDVTQVSTGANSTCAVADSWVYCWGYNYNGQLGTGNDSTSNRELYPKAVVSNTAPTTESIPGLSHYVCTYNFLGICLAGYTVWDRYATSTQPASALVNADGTKKTVTKVSAGSLHTCAIADGKAYCWGDNTYGELGDRSAVPHSFTPVAVDTQATSALAGKTVTDITAGPNFTCALTSEGKTACWGNNAYGQLGTGNRTAYNYPVAVSETTGSSLANKTVKKLAQVKAGSTMCVIDTDDNANCWGANYVGQAGNGQKAPNASSVTDTGSSGPSGGNRYSKCNGHTGSGSGSGTGGATLSNYSALLPVSASGSLTFSDIIMQGDYVTALTADSASNPGRAYWWGGNVTHGYTNNCSTRACGGNDSGNQWCATWSTTTTVYYVAYPPTGPLYDDTSGTTLNKKNLSLVSGRVYGSLFCAVTGSDLYCDTDGTGTTAPVRVYMDGWLLGKSIQQIDTGTSGHNCVVASQAVACWGNNANGQLGDGTVTNRTDPTAVDISTNSDLGKNVTVTSGSLFDNPVSF